MDHEIVRGFKQPREQLACDLEFAWTVRHGRVRVEVLVEYSATLSPVVSVTHEHEVPVATDPVVVLMISDELTESSADVQFIQHRHTSPSAR